MSDDDVFERMAYLDGSHSAYDESDNDDDYFSPPAAAKKGQASKPAPAKAGKVQPKPKKKSCPFTCYICRSKGKTSCNFRKWKQCKAHLHSSHNINQEELGTEPTKNLHYLKCHHGRADKKNVGEVVLDVNTAKFFCSVCRLRHGQDEQILFFKDWERCRRHITDNYQSSTFNELLVQSCRVEYHRSELKEGAKTASAAAAAAAAGGGGGGAGAKAGGEAADGGVGGGGGGGVGGKDADEDDTDTRELCPFFEQGSCAFGDVCRMRHRKGAQGARREICFYFSTQGACRNGDLCRYIHEQTRGHQPYQSQPQQHFQMQQQQQQQQYQWLQQQQPQQFAGSMQLMQYIQQQQQQQQMMFQQQQPSFSATTVSAAPHLGSNNVDQQQQMQLPSMETLMAKMKANSQMCMEVLQARADRLMQELGV